MGCNLNWVEGVLALVILVFTFWMIPDVSQWIIAVAAILLLLQAIICNKSCMKCHAMPKEMPKKTSSKRKIKKRR